MFIEVDGDDFIAQASVFLAARYEPASTTLSFALYELSYKPEIQSQLRVEITEVLAKCN
jgi:cytochrome P450